MKFRESINHNNLISILEELREENRKLEEFFNKYKFLMDNETIEEILECDTNNKENYELKKKIYDLAYYDTLTRLPNKEKLCIDFNELVRIRPQKPIAFFFIDIDNFGYVNSILGYDEGNRFIERFSNLLKERYKDHLVSRISADEFIVIFLYEGEVSELEREIQELSQEIRSKIFIENHEIGVSISTGISIYKKHGEEFYDLLKNADVALYCAKQNGKDRFEIYHELMELKVFNYVDLINQIKIGMNKKEFSMYYQPIVSAKTGKLVGLESLIRWHHTRKGMISPAKFIPIAEETGIMKILEEWIIEEVFNQVKVWTDKKNIDFSVSINLSSKGLIESNLMEFLNSMLDKYEICPNMIEFEVTETAMLKDIDKSLEMLKKLTEKGFNISLDDFGTGYSSLNYLRKLPISKVKLDKSFIDEMGENEKNQFLVKSIIDLSHKFGLKVIAEGVEEIKQIDLLKDMDCDYLQGFYYGKPVSVSCEELWQKDNV